MAGVNKDGGGGGTVPEPSTPSNGSTTHFKVTPENVVDLAALFSQAADVLRPAAADMTRSLRLPSPWLGDPYSKWAQDEFNNYFVDNANSVANVLKQNLSRHVATFNTLKKIAEKYDRTEDLNKQLMKGPGSNS